MGADEVFSIDGNGDAVRTLVLVIPNEDYDGGFETEIQVLNEEGEAIAFRSLNFVGPSVQMINK